jgi:hypothetical protein
MRYTLLLLLCGSVCSAYDAQVEADVSRLENQVRDLLLHIQKLEARVKFIEDNSSEFQLAKAEEREAKRKADEAAAVEASRDKRFDPFTIAAIAPNGRWIKMKDGMILFIRPQDIVKTQGWKVEDVLDIGRLKVKVPIGHGSTTNYTVTTVGGDIEVSVKPW